MFPKNLKDSGGFRNPVLCVPQKNGNKQFSALIYAIWKRRAPKSRVEVDHDFHRWAHHELRRRFAKHAHVYFVTRNPYTRMLSMYLQRVVSHCITDTKEHRCKPGWHNISAKTSFKAFLKIVEERVAKKGSLCKESHHLCQQVESCITTTSRAEKVTQIRLEEQSLWFPCLVKETGMYEKALTKGWSKFNGARSCYYTSTGECKDMLQNIDPNNVTIATGSVHATGASSPDLLRQYYDAEALDIVSRLYADDFRILGYPLWDEEALSLL